MAALDPVKLPTPSAEAQAALLPQLLMYLQANCLQILPSRYQAIVLTLQSKYNLAVMEILIT